MAWAVSFQPVSVEAWVHYQASLFWICGGQGGSGIGFSLSALAVSCEYHSVFVSCSFIDLSPFLCNLSN